MGHFQLDSANSTEWDQFLVSLGETIDWVSKKADPLAPSYNLRSSEIAPNALAGSRREVVRSVQYNRYVELGEFRLAKTTKVPVSSLQGGRLLAFQPDGTLSDGAAEKETQGFFSGDNTPAWDTWVAWFQDIKGTNYGYLVCWIPPALIDEVSSGVDFNPEQCIW